MGNAANACCRDAKSNGYQELQLKEEAKVAAEERKAQEYEASKLLRPIPTDTWGVAMLVIIRDSAEIVNGQCTLITAVRTFFCLIAIITNMFLQFTILYFVQRFIVNQAVHDSQTDYKQYHKEVFNIDGSFNQTAWHVWKGPYMPLCNMAVSKFGFAVVIVFLWTAVMLGEVRSIERLIRDVCGIGRTDGGKLDTVEEKKGDDGEVEEYHVVRVSCLARFMLFTLVIVPKLVIALVLWFIGCRWLCATQSFSDLILNALALEFVVGIDELVYDNFAPKVLQDWLCMTSLVQFKGASKAMTDAAVINGYLRSFLYLILCGTWSVLYLDRLQEVIPSFQHDISPHCGGWFQKYYEPICKFGDEPKLCFPFGAPLAAAAPA